MSTFLVKVRVVGLILILVTPLRQPFSSDRRVQAYVSKSSLTQPDPLFRTRVLFFTVERAVS